MNSSSNYQTGAGGGYTPMMHHPESLSPELRSEPELTATKLQRLISLYAELKAIVELQADQEKFKETLDSVSKSAESINEELSSLRSQWTSMIDNHREFLAGQERKNSFSHRDLDKVPNPDISESIKQLNASIEPMLVPPSDFLN